VNERERLRGRRAMASSGAARRVRCPSCDAIVVEAANGQVTIRSTLPLELITRPGEPGVLLACGTCRTLVPVEPDLVSIA